VHWIAGIAKPSALIRRLRRLGAISSAEVFAARDRSRATGTASKVFERAGNLFCLLEALGTGYGYKDTPFGRLIEEILSERERVATYRFAALIPELAR
jgi:hypothetical protein